MTNVVCIIQARMASQRFPGKVLQPIGTRPVIAMVAARAVKAVFPTVVAMPSGAADDALATYRDGVPGGYAVNQFRWDGPEDDVLGRYAACAREYEADVVVRITGDCPLVDPVAIQGQVRRLLDTGAMYVSNIYPVRTVPSGFDVEVFTATALYVAEALATESSDREHVTPWIQREFCGDPRSPNLVWLPTLHLSLDTPEDLAMIRRVAEKMP